MPSPDLRSVDIPIDVFGGRVTQFDPQKLPMGASPFNRDVVFSGQGPGGAGLVGAVATRPGLPRFYAPFAGNPTVNYLRTFVDSVENLRQLILDGTGVLHQEFPEGTLSIVGTVVAASFCQSDTYAGREWLAVGDSRYGIDIPRQWDGTNFDRVSQVGPGQAPAAADENAVFNILASPIGLSNTTFNTNINASPLGLTEVGNIVTVDISAFGVIPVGVEIGDTVKIAGAGVAGYNGTWVVSRILNSTQFQYINTGASALAASGGGTLQYSLVFVETSVVNGFNPPQLVTIAGAGVAGYNGTWPVRFLNSTTSFFVNTNQFGLAASGNGTVTAAGNISAGLHQVSVAFVTRQGAILCPAPPATWTSIGSKRVVLANIPVGPPNVTQRIVMFTPVITPPATTGPFFYFSASVQSGTVAFPSMVIDDNVTTTATFDFLDAVLQNATAATLLFNQVELGECSSVAAYSERMFWAGERNKVNAAGGGGGFNNLTFDGGFSNPGALPNFPLGWTLDPVFSPGGASALKQGYPVYWGDAYAIVGNGVTPTRGKISQPAVTDYLGVPILNYSSNDYRIRFRAATINGPLSGKLILEIASPSGGSFGSVSMLASEIPAFYQEYDFPLVAKRANTPADTVFSIYSSDTLTVNTAILLDCIEIYPSNQPINRSTVRVSYASNPEAFDSVTGFMIVGKNNGQSIRSMFRLLDNKLYIVKERSMYVTQDDNANEPAGWVITTVSDTVGTYSNHGVGVAEDWAVIACRDGLYIFWGSGPVKISQEIQPDWNTINWAAAQNIYVTVDTFNRRVHVGAPTGNSTTPNTEFVMDYSQLNSAQEIADHPQAYYSQYNAAKVIAPGKARKWTVWNLAGGFGANCCAITLRTDGSFHVMRGNARANGVVYDQQVGIFNDDGDPINSQYQTSFFPETELEQILQLGTHRKLVKYLTGYAAGSGFMTWTITGPNGQRQQVLSNLALQNPPQWDFEKNVNFVGERASLIFGTNAVGSWFQVSKLSPVIQKELLTPVRGSA